MVVHACGLLTACLPSVGCLCMAGHAQQCCTGCTAGLQGRLLAALHGQAGGSWQTPPPPCSQLYVVMVLRLVAHTLSIVTRHMASILACCTSRHAVLCCAVLQRVGGGPQAPQGGCVYQLRLLPQVSMPSCKHTASLRDRHMAGQPASAAEDCCLRTARPPGHPGVEDLGQLHAPHGPA